MSSGDLKTAIARQIGRRFPRAWMERELRFRPHHFEAELWLTPIFCSKEKTAIDIGANMGSYAYYMAKFSNNVIAFEPNADLCKGLRHLLGRRAHLELIALSSKSSKAIMRIDHSNTGVATIEEKNDLLCVKDKSCVITREIETRTLDSYAFTNVSMVKIDVEGHEEAVIDGARETIERNQPVLIIESEDRHNAGAPRRLEKTLSQMGYRGYYLKKLRLMDFSTLCAEDTDPKNLDGGSLAYINNFIFIPARQPALIARVLAHLSGS